MHHSYLDKYARRDSPMHRLNARTKLLLFTSLVVFVAAVPRPGLVVSAVLALSVFLFGAIAKIPISYLIIRSAVIIPFTGFAVLSFALTMTEGEMYWQWGPFALTSEGIGRSAYLLLRAWMAVSFMILLINTTPFNQLVNALRCFRIPSIFVLLLSFFYRYLYLLWDEAERMQRARNLRYFGGFWKKQAALIGNMVTSLFIKSYERAERVQLAMQSRGWDGRLRYARIESLRGADIFTLVISGAGIVILWVIQVL